MPIKPYDELTIQDNFIFQKVMRNKHICKATIERLLDISVRDISYPEEEKTIDVRPDRKSVRLDVYVNDEKGTVFNIEMQTTKDMNELVKRTRYYQALIDIDLLEKGQSYKALNDTYIIFICTFGIFTGNRHKYTFRNLCTEDQNINLNDGTTKLFLSTKGEADDISLPLKRFLEYIDGRAPQDELMKEIDETVKSVKNRDEWRREYMTLALEMANQRAEGREEGRAEGRAEGLAEGEAKGKLDLLKDMVRDGILTIKDAAKRAGLSEELFRKQAML